MSTRTITRGIGIRGLGTAMIGTLALGLATTATISRAFADDENRRPPTITSIDPDESGDLLVRWGPDSFFPGTVPGEAAVLYFGNGEEGYWADNGATNSYTIPAAHVRAYAGQSPRVTVCYLWPSVGHPSECTASDPIPISAGNGAPAKPNPDSSAPPQNLRVVGYNDYRARVQWDNGGSYVKVLWRYDPGTQVDISGDATTATTGILVPGSTYTFKVKGYSSAHGYTAWTELTWTVPSNPPFYPGGSQRLPYGPDQCKQGYVWRGATPSDRVCVLPSTRDQVQADNAQAANRRAGGGAYGPDTCRWGYVWRGTTPADHVCVTPSTRDQAQADNAQAANRRAA